MNLIFLILISVLRSEAYWKLDWSDEFEDKVIDQGNWEIDEGDTKTCDAQNIGRLNCYTNSSRNVRLIDGTLALTAIYEMKNNKKYTSAWVKTKKHFTNGKIEIRAALPIGKMLSPWFKLVPPRLKDKDGSVRNNQVIFFNDQTNDIRYGVSFGKRVGNIQDFSTNGSLNEFHTYSVEWNETDLIWRFDGIETNWVNLSDVQTFLRDPVILMFYLRVGGQPFKNGALTMDDVYEWVCSMLILDYVRHYKWIDIELDQTDNILSSRIKPDRVSVEFCKDIMAKTLPRREEPAGNAVNVTDIISVVCLVILLAMFPLIIWLVIRIKQMKQPERRADNNGDYYDDKTREITKSVYCD